MLVKFVMLKLLLLIKYRLTLLLVVNKIACSGNFETKNE